MYLWFIYYRQNNPNVEILDRVARFDTSVFTCSKPPEEISPAKSLVTSAIRTTRSDSRPLGPLSSAFNALSHVQVRRIGGFYFELNCDGANDSLYLVSQIHQDLSWKCKVSYIAHGYQYLPRPSRHHKSNSPVLIPSLPRLNFYADSIQSESRLR